MRRDIFGARLAGFTCIFLLAITGTVLAQCPAGSTCFGEIDSNSQSPAVSFSGDIPGARWLTHLGDFELTFSSDSTSTQDLGTGDTTFLGNTYRPKVAFTPTGDVLASGNVNASSMLISNSQVAIGLVGDIDGAKWIQHLGDFELTFSSDNSNTTTLGSGDVGLNGRTYRPKVAVDPGGKLLVSGGIVFPDGSLQTKAQAVGPQGPQGAQGPQGPVGAPPFGVCSSQASSPISCSCATLLSETRISGGQTCSTAGLSSNCAATTQGGGGLPTTFGVCCACK